MRHHRKGLITKVVDIRTGFEHATRDTRGRFISRRDATLDLYWLSNELGRRPQALRSNKFVVFVRSVAHEVRRALS